jgi:hypothetical protein
MTKATETICPGGLMELKNKNKPKMKNYPNISKGGAVCSHLARKQLDA